MDTLTRLEATIAARKGADPSTSYVAQLNHRGLPVMARKLGEEAVETVTAALATFNEFNGKDAVPPNDFDAPYSQLPGDANQMV